MIEHKDQAWMNGKEPSSMQSKNGLTSEKSEGQNQQAEEHREVNLRETTHKEAPCSDKRKTSLQNAR